MTNLSVTIDESDPLTYSADALIHPVSGIKFDEQNRIDDFYERCGEDVTNTLDRESPFEVGDTCITGAGELNYESIVHYVVRSAPGTPIMNEGFQTALRSALLSADFDCECGDAALVFPDLDPASDVTDRLTLDLISEMFPYPPDFLTEITLLEQDSEIISCVTNQES